MTYSIDLALTYISVQETVDATISETAVGAYSYSKVDDDKIAIGGFVDSTIVIESNLVDKVNGASVSSLTTDLLIARLNTELGI